jgi:Fe2+ transport system protein B
MTQNYEDYDKRFQNCIDELVVLEDDAKERAEALLKNHAYYQKKVQETADDLARKMTSVERSLSNIRIASENIAGYMAQCEQHADRTRKIFMGAVIGCVLVIVGTLWWVNNLKNNLAQDEKEFTLLENVLKNEPVLMHVNNHDYVRIVPDTETDDLSEQEGSHAMEGRYAKVWYKK